MIDGVEYSDDEYTFINLGRDHPHMYNRTFEGEFYVTISRTVSSDKGDTVDVFIRIREPGDLEIGKNIFCRRRIQIKQEFIFIWIIQSTGTI